MEGSLQIKTFQDAYRIQLRQALKAKGFLRPSVEDRTQYVVCFKEALCKERERIEKIHLAGADGAEVVYRITAWTDVVLMELFQAALHFSGLDEKDVPCVLMAIGGYGRGELNPFSDLDVMFLTRGKIDAKSREASEACLYLMWDLNLDIGHSIRDIRGCVDLAASDIKAKTSLIESRYLAGSADVYAAYLKEAKTRILSRNAVSYLRVKIADVSERHKKFGGSLYMKEPHVKEGVGGLRDIHTALWVAKVKYGVDSLHALIDRGEITAKEGEVLRHSLEFLWKVRNHLHYLSGRRNDRLTVDLQDEVAAFFKYRDFKHYLAVERFMRVYYLHSRNVRYFTNMIVNRCSPSPGRRRFSLFPYRKTRVGKGFSIVGNRLCVPEGQEDFFREDPHRLIEVFALAQRYGLPIADVTRQNIVASLRLVNDEFRSSDRVRETFLRILCAESGVVSTLRQMHELRFLGKYIPEFGALTALVQHELYHVYTVDEHTLNTMEQLEKLNGTKYPEEQFYADLVRKVRNREILYLALLLHDIGRAMGRGHVRKGGKAVPLIMHRMGLSKEAAQAVEFLVRNHLVMTHLSQRRDIYDLKLIAQFAMAVQDVDQLRMLTLLTYCDIRGVGPSVWNEWKDTLLRELFSKAQDHLLATTEQPIEQTLLKRLQRIRDRIRRDGEGVLGEGETDRILLTLPDHYLLSTPHQAVLKHLSMIRKAEEEGFVTGWNHYPEKGYSEMYVCAYDSDTPGFFSRIAGALAARGINIFGARIFTSSRGIVIDTIHVEAPGEPGAADPAYWKGIEDAVRSVAEGVSRVDEMLVEHRSPSYLRKPQRHSIPSRVQFDNAISQKYTVIDVSAKDRVGLLYQVTSCLAAQRVHIHSAKVTTEEERAIDAFYVTDIFGHKITDHVKRETIRAALMKTLNEPKG
jgi:[protein-PII] uridylyltransferase